MRRSFLQILFPFFFWFKDYSVTDLKADWIAGVTVALVLIPQSMAYAQLAGLPVYYGLYASFLPPMVAALFGSSRRLATGPVAVVSMMTAASLEPFAIAGSEAFVVYAILLAFCVGLFQLLLGVLRLGIIVNLLSHPVVTGFINAAALIIAGSQLSKFFGVHVDKADHFYETMARVFTSAVHYTHWPTVFMGMLALFVMLGCKRVKPGLPCVLFAVIVTTTLSWLTGFEKNRYVSVASLQVPEIQKKIEELNFSFDTIVRTMLAKDFVKDGLRIKEEEMQLQKERPTCGRCHSNRAIEIELLKSNDTAIGTEKIPLAKILELHLMAGVLDSFLIQEKKHTSLLRNGLRSLQLVSVKQPDGSLVYKKQSTVPPDKRAEKNIWHLPVGNEPLNPDRILLIGGGEVVGNVPAGLPSFSLPKFDITVMKQLFLSAIIISILGFMEAISIAKDMAARSGYRLDPNQELIGQGLANIAGSFSGSFPVSGSFSRSAVNFQAGAVSGLSSVFTSISVVVALLFCTPLLYYLPQSVLAAIIMVAVVGLLNIRDIKHAFIVKRSDGVISVITFAATLFFAPHLDKGILLGVILSAVVFFYGRMRPVIAELSLWTDNHYRNIRLFNLKQCPYIAVIRFDGPLFYANISYLEDEVLKTVRRLPQLKIIHFKCNGINDMDTSGEHALTLLVKRLQSAGYQVYFSGLKVLIVDMMRRSGLLEIIGEDHIFPTLVAALEIIWPIVHVKTDKDRCPLTTIRVNEDGKSRTRRQIKKNA